MNKHKTPKDNVIRESDQSIKGYEYSFPIVAIGASAGGLQAFESFFSGIPKGKNTGMAFVLIQHISPDYKSRLVEIIQNYTEMNVHELTQRMKVEKNNVYIIPSSTDISLQNGEFVLQDTSITSGAKFPINHFFGSLAAELGEQAIGVILSGSGTDGTYGFESIKREHGLILAQDPATCEFSSMPTTAIDTGLVDYVAEPKNIYSVICSYIKDNQNRVKAVIEDDVLTDIFDTLFSASKIDFSNYKRGTIGRRIQRRMHFNKINSLDDYATYLKTSKEESEVLVNDMLINVTNFFRDNEVFDVLKNETLPQYLKDLKARDHLRIWVAGCSTGEEAYSIAILVHKTLAERNQLCRVSIFATDVDGFAIAKARKGVYSKSIDSLVPKQLLETYFTFDDDTDTYKISKAIRDMLFFSVHNAISDPPFSRIDLISCRNLLIYFDEVIQKNLLSTFHYALKNDGLLLLGISESVSTLPEAFEVVNQKVKLFKRPLRKTDGTIPYIRQEHTLSRNQFTSFDVDDFERNLPFTRSNADAARDIILTYSPISGIIIDAKGDIIYLKGEVGNYLDPSQGESIIGNVFKMIKADLKHDLEELLQVVKKTTRMESKDGIQFTLNKYPMAVDMTVAPLRRNAIPNHQDDLFLILLQESKSTYNEQAVDVTTGVNIETDEAARLHHLIKIKEELIMIKSEELNSTKQDYESMKEEMQSINEELQSTNEELETTTEELQSINEELNITNAELNSRVQELTTLNNDFENLINGARLPLLFLNQELSIMRLTKDTSKIINIVASDYGRSISDFSTNFIDYNNFLNDCNDVLKNKKEISIEVQTKDLKWYTMIIKPYVTTKSDSEGVSIVFIEITDRIKAEKELQQKELLFRSTLNGTEDVITLAIDPDYNYLYLNNAHKHIMKMIYGTDVSIGSNLLEAVTIASDRDKAKKNYDLALQGISHTQIEPYGKHHEDYFESYFSPLKNEEDEIIGASVFAKDITTRQNNYLERVALVEQLERSEVLLKSFLESAKDMIIIALDTEYRYLYFNSAHAISMKESYDAEVEIGKSIFDYITSEMDKENIKINYDKTLSGISHSKIQMYGELETNPFEIFFNPIYDDTNTIVGLTVFAHDISERMSSSKKIKASEERFRQLYSSMSQGLALHEVILDDKGNPIDYVFLEMNDSYTEITGLSREKTIGKRVKEVLPNVEQYWIDTFGRVAVTGEPKYFENYVKELDKHFATYSYSPKENHFAVLVTDITDRIIKEKQITFLSYNDQLTGLFNRRHYEKTLLELDNEENLPISLIMGDVNGLKLVNDSFGHLVGDELLQKVAESMKRACRQDDIICRIGGDEFVIILPKTSRKIAKKVVERIISNTKKESVKSIDISISFGFGTKTTMDHKMTELFKTIEDDMYRIKLNESKSMRSKTVDVIQATLYAKNKREMHHSMRVGDLCEKLALKLKMKKDAATQLKTAGLMHDIGKIGISEVILNKTGALNKDEWLEVKRHSEIGYRILSSVNEFSELAKCVLEHHENWDGTGYPEGLQDKDISIQGRIVRICDAYDAMTGPRTYRDPLTKDEAIQELINNAGTQFDPALVKTFIDKVLDTE